MERNGCIQPEATKLAVEQVRPGKKCGEMIDLLEKQAQKMRYARYI